jgi:hypothetical protein
MISSFSVTESRIGRRNGRSQNEKRLLGSGRESGRQTDCGGVIRAGNASFDPPAAVAGAAQHVDVGQREIAASFRARSMWSPVRSDVAPQREHHGCSAIACATSFRQGMMEAAGIEPASAAAPPERLQA